MDIKALLEVYVTANRHKVLDELRFGQWRQIRHRRGDYTTRERCAVGVIAESLTHDMYASTYQLAAALQIPGETLLHVELMNDIYHNNFSEIADWLERRWKEIDAAR